MCSTRNKNYWETEISITVLLVCDVFVISEKEQSWHKAKELSSIYNTPSIAYK